MSQKQALCLLLVLLSVEALILDAQTTKNRQRPLLGGWQPMDRNSQDAQEAARKAVTHLQATKNSALAYRLHELEEVKYQIVSGRNYQLKLVIAQTNCTRIAISTASNCETQKTQRCNVVLYEPLGSAPTRLTNFTCEKEKKIGKKPGPKKPIMPGGETNIDVSSDEVRQAATFATEQLSSSSNGKYRVQHQRIIKATSQIVSGVLYRLTIEVSVTFSGSNKVKTTRCQVKVWDQPWMNPRFKLSEYKCNRHIA